MLSIEDSIRVTYPDTKMGILVMQEVSYFSSCKAQELEKLTDSLHKKYGHLDRKELKEVYPIGAYVTYYKKFGSSYHLLSQLESMLKGVKSIHSKSGLLQAMLLSELDSMLLTAGYDFSKLHLPLTLTSANGTETYQSISGKDVTVLQRDMILCDQSGVISSILKGPDYQSSITESTTEVLFSIYAPPCIETEYIKKNLKRLEYLIKSFSPAAKTKLLEVFC